MSSESDADLKSIISRLEGEIAELHARNTEEFKAHYIAKDRVRYLEYRLSERTIDRCPRYLIKQGAYGDEGKCNLPKGHDGPCDPLRGMQLAYELLELQQKSLKEELAYAIQGREAHSDAQKDRDYALQQNEKLRGTLEIERVFHDERRNLVEILIKENSQLKAALQYAIENRFLPESRTFEYRDKVRAIAAGDDK